MRNRSRCTRAVCALLSAAAFAACLSPAGGADRTADWLGDYGAWSEPSNWSTDPYYPDNGNGGFTYQAQVDAGQPTLGSDVTVDAAVLSGEGLLGLGGGLLNVNDALTWTQGVFSGGEVVLGPACATIAGGGTWQRRIEGGAVVTNYGTWTDLDAFHVASDGTLSNHGLLKLHWGIDSDGQVRNTGTLRAGDGGTCTVRTGVHTPGVVEAIGTELLFTGPIQQKDSGDLNDGTWRVLSGGRLDLGGWVWTNRATIEIRGFYSTWDNVTGGLYQNFGTLIVGDGKELRLDAPDSTTALTNAGVVRVEGAGSELYVPTGRYRQSDGETLLDGGALRLPRGMTVDGGVLAGSGDVWGNVTLATGATMVMEIGGVVPRSEYDCITIDGSAVLGGRLRVGFLDGFEDRVDHWDAFTLVTATGGLGGVFDNVPSGGWV